MVAIANIKGPIGNTGPQGTPGTNGTNGVGFASICFWKSDVAATGIANQGLNLPSALTELDSAVQGTRTIVESADIGAQVQIVVNARIVVAFAGGTITTSIRDTSNTANVLATVNFSANAIGTQVVKSVYAAKPGWLTGDKTLAVYTSGGNATADFIFKDVSLRSK